MAPKSLTQYTRCNAYSLLGERKGAADSRYGDLPRYLIKVLEAKRPLVVLLENVPAFFSTLDQTGAKHYELMKKDLERIHYRCAYKLYAAQYFGLPQHRVRGFLVAIREDVDSNPFQFPPPPVLDNPGVTVRSILLDPESPLLAKIAKLDPYECDLKVRSRTAWPAGLQRTWDDIIDLRPNTSFQVGICTLGRLEEADSRNAYVNVLHDLGRSPTIVCRLRSGPWFLTKDTKDLLILRKLHFEEMRRLQGFPEGFKLHKSGYVTHAQLGQAVPPPMVEFLGKALKQRYPRAFNGPAGPQKIQRGTKRPASDQINPRAPKVPASSSGSLLRTHAREGVDARPLQPLAGVNADETTQAKAVIEATIITAVKTRKRASSHPLPGSAQPVEFEIVDLTTAKEQIARMRDSESEDDNWNDASESGDSDNTSNQVWQPRRKHGFSWDSGDDETLETMRATGCTMRQIAAVLGRTPSAVSSHLHYVQYAASPHRRFASVVDKAAYPASWTEEEVDKLRRLKKAGASVEVISVALGRTKGAVSFKWGTVKNTSVETWE